MYPQLFMVGSIGPANYWVLLQRRFGGFLGAVSLPFLFLARILISKSMTPWRSRVMTGCTIGSETVKHWVPYIVVCLYYHAVLELISFFYRILLNFAKGSMPGNQIENH